MKEIIEYETIRVDVDKILMDEANPNVMDEETEKRLRRSMEEFGNTQDIIVDADTMILADGEHRLNEYKKKGIKTIPVKLVPFKNDASRRAYRQAANKIRGLHNPEMDAAEYLKIIQAGEAELLKIATGMSLTDVSAYLRKHELLSKEEEAFDVDAEVAANKNPVAKYGEVYKLGRHRIMCGDSTIENNVAFLMQEDKADLVITDPPYGVSYRGTNNPNGKEWGVMDNDDLREGELANFLFASFNNAFKFTKENPAVYVFYASSNHTIFENALNAAGFKVKQQLIWDKGMVLGHSDYHWTHEPILYCIKAGQNSAWWGTRAEQTLFSMNDRTLNDLKKEELVALLQSLKDQSSIVKIKKDFAGFYMHPTQKPVELAMKFIANNTPESEEKIILDLFSGSGSVLLACEKTGRTARVMELDPRYVDVCVRRWEELTGEKAERIQ